jgi:O-antigen/teichoic acid export membrane protein
MGIDFGIEYIFTSDYKDKAMSIALPVLLLVILSEIGMIFHSIIEGFQRMEVNALISIVGQLSMLVIVFVLVPNYGLRGVIFSQIAQALIVLLFSLIWIKRKLPELNIIPQKWSLKILKSMLGYGANISLTNASSFLMDPITKIFLTKLGSPSLSGYFELSSQFIQRFRSILLTANSAVIPKIAENTVNNKEYIKEIYSENLKLAGILSLAAYSILLASSDLISIAIFNDIQPTFINILNILTVSWLINVLSAPAYFSNLGTGNVSLNSITQIMMGLLNVIFCYILGNELNGLGVIFSYATAISLASISLYIFYHKYMNIKWNIFINIKELRLFSYLAGIFMISLISSSNYIINERDILIITMRFLFVNIVVLLIVYNIYKFYKINKFLRQF